jgi:hypothetical protein
MARKIPGGMMQTPIRVYNKSLELQVEIDAYTDLLFTRQLSEAGSFSFSINYNLVDAAGFRYADYLQRGYFITVGTNYKRIGVILETAKAIDESGKGGQVVTVSGREAKVLFGRRVVLPPNGFANYTSDAEAETVIKDILTDNIGSGASVARRMTDIFTITADQARGDTYEYSSRYKNLAEDIKSICDATGLGVSNEYNPSTGKIDIDIIEGVDRTARQSVNNRVIISTDYDTLSNAEVRDSEIDYSNVVIAAGQGVGTDREVQTVYDTTEPTGIERREVFQDMRDLSTIGAIQARAANILADKSVTKFIDAGALSYSQLQIGVDYELGDYITISAYDETEDVQVTMVQESWSPGQYQIQLAFNRSYPELPKQLKAKAQTDAQTFNNVETGPGLNATTADSATNADNADELGGELPSYYRNSSNQNAGTLPDARLSSNVPLKNAANVFTAKQTIQSSDGIEVSSLGSDPFTIIQGSTSELTKIDRNRSSGNVRIELNPKPADGTSLAEIRCFRDTNTSGTVQLSVYKGNNTATTSHELRGSGTFELNANNESIGATGARIRNLSTGSGTDVVINASGYMLLKTSSRRYKKDIEPMTQEYAENFVDKAEAVFYRLIEDGDCYPENWSHWGLIAEDLADVDPRLVNWGYWPEDYEEVTTYTDEQVTNVIEAENGEKFEVVETVKTPCTSKELKKDAQLSPIGVKYDRIAVLMLKVMQKDRQRLNDLEKRLSKLEGK